MNTYFGILAQFGKAEIPLEECCDMLGYSPKEAKRRAALDDLPLPVYRAGSQRSPWMVAATDLAALLDVRKADARANWRKMHERYGNATELN